MISSRFSLFGRTAIVAAAVALSAPLPSISHAAESNDMTSHHVASFQSHDTLLSFTTQGEAKAIPNQLTIHFSARTQSKSPATAQKTLNQMVQTAMNSIKNEKEAMLRADNYSLSQEYSDHSPRRWNAEQNLTLKGGDSAHLLVLTEKLQSQGLAVENMSWSLDPETHQKLEAQARTEALKKIRSQADSDASALGLHVVKLEQIQVGENFNHEPRFAMAAPMMMSARSGGTPPQSTPKEQKIHVSVSARVRLAAN